VGKLFASAELCVADGDVFIVYIIRWHLDLIMYFQAEVVKDPIRRAKFKQFANTEQTMEKEAMIEFIDMRGQKRPADWAKDGQPQTRWRAPEEDVFAHSEKSWVTVGKVSDFDPNVGTPILYGETQLAVFNNAKRGEWYCTQNMCPHKQAFVLSQGILGDVAGTPKVACPLHKKQFALEDGHELSDGDLRILTFPVRIDDKNNVLVELPAVPELDAILGTHGLRVRQSSCIDIAQDAIKIPIKNKNGFSANGKKSLVQEGEELVGSIRGSFATATLTNTTRMH